MYCPRCGIENATDAETCVSCGHDLRLPAQRDPYEDAPGPPVYAPQPPAPQPVQYQAPYQGQVPGGLGKIPNYLAQSITIAIFGACCWIVPTILAIPAIVFGSQVNSKLDLGDVMGATNASRNARIWCWVSFASLLLVGLVWLLFMALVVAGSVA